MQAKTDLERVKSVARTLLMTPIHQTKFSPMVVQHPFTSSGIIGILQGETFVPLDITQSEENLAEWQRQMIATINEAENAYKIYMLTNKPYSLTFLKYAEPHLSRTDFSQILADAWMRSETPNCDANVSKAKLVAFFKQAEPSVLMTEQEREQLADLDEPVTVYRGVTSYNAKNIRALSWTLDYEKAEWFAHRYAEDGTVYEAQINKRHILALFNGRNESEVVVDPKGLTDITEAQAPNLNITQTM